MRILVACELSDAALDELRSLAAAVESQPHLAAERLAESLADVGVLVVADQRVAGDAIRRAKALQMIVHAGTGPANVALEEASAQGIFVTHCPHMDAVAVAEHALALLLALDRRVCEYNAALHEAGSTRPDARAARGLAGRTLGLLGFGQPGALLARRAQALEMNVVAWAPAGTPESSRVPHVSVCNWPREVARKSDAVVVLPAVDSAVRTIVDAEFLENLSAGATIIHVGQPALVDEAALAAALPKRNFRVGVDLSVAASDGIRGRSRLLELPGVLATPGVSTLTEQARTATAAEVVRVVRAFLVSGEVLNCVNLAERSPATWQLVLRVRDQVGVMASILDAVRADGINAEEIISRVFTGAKAAWISIALDDRPSGDALESIRALGGVLHLELRAMV